VAYNEVFVAADDGSIHGWNTQKCASPPCSPSWTAKTPSAFTSALVVADSVLYAASSNGSLYTYTARGLHTLATFNVSAGALTSPAVADGAIYVGSSDGTLHVFGYPQSTNPPPSLSSLSALTTPIRHVVLLFQENNSFDEILGKLCVTDARCDGATTGTTSDGQTRTLTPEPDILPNVAHSVEAQTASIDGGKMDGFDKIQGCTAADNYACYSQVSPRQIPNLAALARSFVISDRTFEETDSPSFGGHIALAASQLDGFQGDAPGQPSGAGWGCDSNLTAPWINPATHVKSQVPACIPRPDGSGPFTASPVASVPTIMDRLDAAGYPWRIYDGDYGTSHAGYAWAVCPMFANCLYSADEKGMTSEAQIIQDANHNALPSLSLVIPAPTESQHNSDSITQGDNWIGSVVSSIENSPDWDSTAIFITYDDCGCFYDHVPPPAGLGIRVPMVIISPYAKAAYTDSTVASFASVLAYMEHTLSVPSLNGDDSSAYDYAHSFDYSQAPLHPVPMVRRPVPPASLRYMKMHPLSPDDPT
jgi:phospholipase C